MRIRSIFAAVLIAGATVAAAAPAEARINQRQGHQQHRIYHGVQSGQLTGREVYRLERQQAHIARYERRSRRDGPGLTLSPRADAGPRQPQHLPPAARRAGEVRHQAGGHGAARHPSPKRQLQLAASKRPAAELLVADAVNAADQQEFGRQPADRLDRRPDLRCRSVGEAEVRSEIIVRDREAKAPNLPGQLTLKRPQAR